MKTPLPRFLNQHSDQSLPSYGAVCKQAREHGVPGVGLSPFGYGWVIEDEETALAALIEIKNEE